MEGALVIQESEEKGLNQNGEDYLDYRTLSGDELSVEDESQAERRRVRLHCG